MQTVVIVSYMQKTVPKTHRWVLKAKAFNIQKSSLKNMKN